MKIAIIGAAGKMGVWFTQYFIKQNHEVFLFDINSKNLKLKYSKLINSHNDKNNHINYISDLSCLKDVELIFVSTPISDTSNIINNLVKYSTSDCVILEINSLKESIFPTLKSLSIKNSCIPISIHPLFGPGTTVYENRKIVLVPIKDDETEKMYIRKLFPEFQIICVNYSEHDKAMAIILSLTHYINTVFSHFISKRDINLLNKLSSPTFALQLINAESLFNEADDLISSIQLENLHSSDIVEEFIADSHTIGDLIKNRDKINMEKTLKKIQKRLIQNRKDSFLKSHNLKTQLFENIE